MASPRKASPGSKSVINSLKEKVSQEKSGLNNESKVPSRVFQMLQKQLDEEEAEDLPPPPPELIEDEEETRPSFGSSGPGQQSRTFRHLQEAVDTGGGHQSVFSRPAGERNKAVPMPSQQPKPVAPQVTTVNAIPKAPMPSGPNFKISSAPKAPSFKATAPSSSSSSSNAYKPPSYNAPSQSAAAPAKSPVSAPSFKPSTVPQPVSPPQKTTAKVPSTKPAMPLDPSRVPVCHSCNEQIRGPFVSAIGKTWHPEHFCCSSCQKSLQNQGFVEEANKLYCEQCFNHYLAPQCASCGQPIIGVRWSASKLCEYCTRVRSTGDELQPVSLREIIVGMKNEIRESEKRAAEYHEMRQDTLMRWKKAYAKHSQIRKDLVMIGEKKERAEEKLEQVEKRLDLIIVSQHIIDENTDKYKTMKMNSKRNEEELVRKIEYAKRLKNHKMQELSKNLAYLSQRGYHYRFVAETCEDARLKIVDLQDQLDLLARRKEYLLSQREVEVSESIKQSALIEQFQDDIIISRKRSERARNLILKREIEKERLFEEIDFYREKRREVFDALQNAKRVKENQRRKMFTHEPVQHYR